MDDGCHIDPENEAAALRVLVVEDHPANQRLVVAILKPHGYELVLAENGQEAYETWEAGEFDMILMDMQMPVMDGLDATRKIRAMEVVSGRGRTPIAMFTAHAMEDHMTMTRDAGADHHIAKPVTPSNLVDGIAQTLANAESANGLADDGTTQSVAS